MVGGRGMVEEFIRHVQKKAGERTRACREEEKSFGPNHVFDDKAAAVVALHNHRLHVHVLLGLGQDLRRLPQNLKHGQALAHPRGPAWGAREKGGERDKEKERG